MTELLITRTLKLSAFGHAGLGDLVKCQTKDSGTVLPYRNDRGQSTFYVDAVKDFLLEVAIKRASTIASDQHVIKLVPSAAARGIVVEALSLPCAPRVQVSDVCAVSRYSTGFHRWQDHAYRDGDGAEDIRFDMR